jgi:hypothetical protein
MLLLLLFHGFRQLLQLLTGTGDVAPRLFALFAIQVRSGGGHALVDAVHDRGYRFQIADEFFGFGWRRLGLRLPLCFQEQLGLLENAFAGLA